MHNNKSKKIIFEAFMMIISVTFLLPFWMVIINSLKSEKEAALFSLGLPNAFHFVNYINVFKEANILRAMLNGFYLAFVIGLLSLLLSSMAAFAISRIRNKVTEIAYYLFISGIILPGATIPTFFLLNKMKLINTYTGIILVLLAHTMPIAVFLYSGLMKTVPRELDEAGIIDGCGRLKLFFNIIFPILKPATITIIIFNFMGVWNDVSTQLYFANADKWTMPMMVYRFQGMYSSKWNLIFADLVLTSIPVIVVYSIGQKYMVSGMTSGAVKG